MVSENDILKAINALFRYHFEFGQSEMTSCETMYGMYSYIVYTTKPGHMFTIFRKLLTVLIDERLLHLFF